MQSLLPSDNGSTCVILKITLMVLFLTQDHMMILKKSYSIL